MMTTMKFRVTLRFDSEDGDWQETTTILASSLNDADNIASRMQVERDADAVYVVSA